MVTHDGPHGMSSWRGTTQGSRKLTELLERLQPRLHVSGLLDTRTYDFEYVHDPWLADIHGDQLDLAGLIAPRQ
ncbi:hypothetical protein [Actinomadura sp. 7K507]|uniref:hypothetical protein n=1 Tax=Actinomadura sp. 7K507 TaxID=2530365 RepID=UPI0010510D42|nr:hypothetical protein [Actinomadura sp. 7K507]TDC73701.1 hypothetical protein E1285_44380 [Actinomadura sp. 7K507]